MNVHSNLGLRGLNRGHVAPIVAALLLAGTVTHAQVGSAPPTRAARMAALAALQADLVPLFVLGDVNEDGKVDAQDLALLRALAEASAHGSPAPADATCPAAGDFDMSTTVDGKDVDQLAAILKAGHVVRAALAWQPRVPCAFSWFRVATRPDAQAGEVVPVRFLRPGMTTATCAVTVQDGPASVRPSSDGLGFDVTVASNAAPGSIVTLLLRLGQDGEYFYALPITPLPPRPK
jgi:hypothetical protein